MVRNYKMTHQAAPSPTAPHITKCPGDETIASTHTRKTKSYENQNWCVDKDAQHFKGFI